MDGAGAVTTAAADDEGLANAPLNITSLFSPPTPPLPFPDAAVPNGALDAAVDEA